MHFTTKLLTSKSAEGDHGAAAPSAEKLRRKWTFALFTLKSPALIHRSLVHKVPEGDARLCLTKAPHKTHLVKVADFHKTHFHKNRNDETNVISHFFSLHSLFSSPRLVTYHNKLLEIRSLLLWRALDGVLVPRGQCLPQI